MSFERTESALLIPALLGQMSRGLDRTPAAIIDALQRRGVTVHLGVADDLDLDPVRSMYGVQLKDVEMVPAAPPSDAPLLGRLNRVLRPIRLRIANRSLTRPYDLTIVQNRGIPLVPHSDQAALFCEFPDPNPTGKQLRRLAGFDLILANSHFTARWIERYWGVAADVLYPSVHEPGIGPKSKTILSVARFYQSGRPKGHWDLIEAFKRLVDRGTRDWELVLAGLSTHPDVHRRMEDAASGYPIRFLLDADIERLSEAYREAAIFWHGAGLGVDPEAEPGRLEHFGITVAEAMCAGAVPLVHGVGGPVEIVADHACCWANLEELVDKTEELIREPDQLARRGAEASESAIARFGVDAFAHNVERLFLQGRR